MRIHGIVNDYDSKEEAEGELNDGGERLHRLITAFLKGRFFIFLAAVNAVLWCAHKAGFVIEYGFHHSLGIIDRHADTQCQ